MEHCKKPCNECPFRKDSLRGWLSAYSPTELHQIVMNEKPFPCHMTHDGDIEWEDAGSKTNPLCAGALIYMKQAFKSPRNPDIAKCVKNIDRDTNILSVPEFFSHHNINKSKQTV